MKTTLKKTMAALSAAAVVAVHSCSDKCCRYVPDYR